MTDSFHSVIKNIWPHDPYLSEIDTKKQTVEHAAMLANVMFGADSLPDPTSYGAACVTCMNGDITQVSLVGNGLNGTIPLSVGSMTALNYMWLEVNNLKGTIPSSLASLTKLTNL